MKRLISTLLHIFSIVMIIASFCILKINFPNINIHNLFEQNSFTDTQEYKDITSRMIDDVFNLYDYKTLYEIKGEVNYNTKVATSYRNNTYYDWTLKDVIDLAKTYGIIINEKNAIEENGDKSVANYQKKELYTNLIYDDNLTVSSLSTNRMTEYDFCKKILSHFTTYRQIDTNFSDDNTNFTYIIRYYTDTKLKEYYNHNATLNDIFSSKSFLYISSDINEIKSNIDIDNTLVTNALIERIPFKDASYYFACSVDLSLKNDDIYKNVFNNYNTIKTTSTMIIYTLLGSIILFLITFISTFFLCINAKKNTEKSNNLLLFIPTEILIIIFLALGIELYLLIPKLPIIIELTNLTNTNIPLLFRFTTTYICIILFFIIINEKYIGLRQPEPRLVLGAIDTFNKSMAKIFKSIPIFSYIFFFFIPIILLLVFTIYCFLVYNQSHYTFAIVAGFVCALLFILFIMFIIIVNRGFLRTINDSTKNEKMRSDLVTNVSHDIRTPLTSIINYTDLLSKEINSSNRNIEQMKHYINVLVDKSNRLKKLIDDLMFSSKASSGNLELNMQKLDITELTYQILADYESKFAKRELNVIKNIENEHIYIFADGDKIYRIYENIFDNIVKYALHDTDVHIYIQQIEREVNIKIDNISSENALQNTSAITDRFIKGDESRNSDGFGLGLSIVSDLTRLMNGTFIIDYDNTIRRFTVHLTFNIYYGL